MRFRVQSILIVIATASITLSIGMANFHQEQIDDDFFRKQCRTVRSNIVSWPATFFLGHRAFNPVVELDLYGGAYPDLSTNPGGFCATLDEELKQMIHRLENLETVWVNTELYRYSASKQETAIAAFPHLEIKNTTMQNSRFGRRRLPRYQWFNWLALFTTTTAAFFLVPKLIWHLFGYRKWKVLPSETRQSKT